MEKTILINELGEVVKSILVIETNKSITLTPYLLVNQN